MKKLTDLIPVESLKLVKFNGKELIDRLGKDIITNVVLSVLCGDNIRDLTEGLTKRRILLMNASLFITYMKALRSFKDFSKNLSKISGNEIKGRLSDDKRCYLLWFLGLTGKSIKNVIRGTEFSKYLNTLDKNLSEISKDVTDLYGPLELHIENDGLSYLMQWPDLLRCMMAIGAQTLTIRGSEKSTYGKLFEKFVLGSALSILGFQYINSKSVKSTKVFWFNEKKLNKRETDAIAILKPGFGITFDIGFIGEGNTEISLDKVSRYARIMERNGKKTLTTPIILIDKIGDRSMAEQRAREIGGYIIQMSGTYWVHELAHTIKKEFSFYRNPILKMNKDESLKYIKKELKRIDLSQFLSTPSL